tara:strand:- start:20770 stop:21006 length:237 start_codon:yes stop_codon:yes gene_type:complete
MIRISLLLASLLLVACNYSDPKFGPNAGPDVGPVAAVLDGDENADPLAATIDVSNENAELMDNDPLLYEQQEAEVLSP